MSVDIDRTNDIQTEQIWRDLIDCSVECELCEEPFDEHENIPRLLWCGHTYCQNCLGGWANANTYIHNEVEEINCPSCRQITKLYANSGGVRGLPKNFVLLRVRSEMESNSQAQFARIQALYISQLQAKEASALKAQEKAILAQKESERATARALELLQQVELNAQERQNAKEEAKAAQDYANEAKLHARLLQEETEKLKEKLQIEAEQLQLVQNDAVTHAATAAALQSKALALQKQVESVTAQLALHSGAYDVSTITVLVMTPTTVVGSWLSVPYTRYTVISIASANGEPIDIYNAAKHWTLYQQVPPGASNVKVYRRYSDFVWLHRQLTRRFPLEFIPSLPAKALYFHQDVEFVAERMKLLQAFVQDIVQHSTLSTAAELKGFLFSTTEELEKLRTATQFDETEIENEVESTADYEISHENSNGAAQSNSVTKKKSKWGWKAMASFTTSAAKLVTSTSPQANHVSPNESLENLSDSLKDALDESPAEPSALLRRQVIQCAHLYTETCEKGAQVFRNERAKAQHIHGICQMLTDLDRVEREYTKKRWHRLATSVDFRQVAQRQHMELIEAEANGGFHGIADPKAEAIEAQVSEVFAAMAIQSQHMAECQEYALLDVCRRQQMQLRAVEDVYNRVRRRENRRKMSLQQASDENVRYTRNNSSQDDIATIRNELENKVHDLEKQRVEKLIVELPQIADNLMTLAKERRLSLERQIRQLQGK